MTGFPWDIAIGLGIVLLGTGAFVIWILMLDRLESDHASEKRSKPEDH